VDVAKELINGSQTDRNMDADEHVPAVGGEVLYMPPERSLSFSPDDHESAVKVKF